jgi:acyl carrier protein
MDKKNIEEKVRQVIMETLGLPEAECTAETILQSDPLGLIQLAMQLEFKFGIEIDEDTFMNETTVQGIFDLVASKLGV